MKDLERYRKAIRAKVCNRCIDQGEDGCCSLSGDQRCGVELYLEKIVDVVHSVRSKKLKDYVEQLRKHVCSDCKNQNPDGTCQLRSEADCGLDGYFAVVVEAIEEEDQKTK